MIIVHSKISQTLTWRTDAGAAGCRMCTHANVLFHFWWLQPLFSHRCEHFRPISNLLFYYKKIVSDNMPKTNNHLKTPRDKAGNNLNWGATFLKGLMIKELVSPIIKSQEYWQSDCSIRPMWSSRPQDLAADWCCVSLFWMSPRSSSSLCHGVGQVLQCTSCCWYCYSLAKFLWLCLSALARGVAHTVKAADNEKDVKPANMMHL